MHPYSCVETIRIEQGRADQLDYHNRRMNNTRKACYGASDVLDLHTLIRPEAYESLTRCRVEYTDQVVKIEYLPYQIRPVESLQLVYDDTIDYTYKSTDRSALNALFEKRGTADDILIVKQGLLTDTSIGNIALYNGYEWITPRTPLLAGTRRAALLDAGMLTEADVCPEELTTYSRLCIFNAMIPFGTLTLPVKIHTQSPDSGK